LEIKNEYTDDNKYLAVITENGLWIKDIVDNKINIINASKVDNEFLIDVSIVQFDKDYEIIRTIESKKINISSYNWKIIKPKISENNTTEEVDEIYIKSNFDIKKINSLFSNLASLTIYDLIKLRRNYESLNYSLTEIDSHFYKIITYPLYLTLITILTSIIMFNISYQKSSLFRIILGIFLSVIIYYISNFFIVLGTSEKIPLLLSIWFPLIILSIINITFVVRLNEK
jgi:lipopolysaccharide export system permease protein